MGRHKLLFVEFSGVATTKLYLNGEESETPPIRPALLSNYGG